MRYRGGKGGCFRHIINQMPPHRVYIEPFLGGGNVVVNKRPAAVSVGVDLDLETLARFHKAHRGAGVRLIRADAVTFLRRYPFTGDELVYCDPPYVHATRQDKNIYRWEYSDEQHAALLMMLHLLPCLVVVSGYRCELYDSYMRSWRRVDFESTTRQGLRTESLWCNYPPPAQLHDPRYAGADYRERERIKRRRNRWRRRFEAMDAAERQVVLDALIEVLPSSLAAVSGPSSTKTAMHDRASKT